jgi:hypothetical protein
MASASWSSSDELHDAASSHQSVAVDRESDPHQALIAQRPRLTRITLEAFDVGDQFALPR